MYNQKLGKQGEELVCGYVRAHGMDVIEQNFYGRGGEIDIIARDGDTVAFVEVKTRTSTRYGTAAEAVTYAKMCKIKRTAQQYVMLKRLHDQNCRFDVAEVYRDKDGFKINYIENAFI